MKEDVLRTIMNMVERAVKESTGLSLEERPFILLNYLTCIVGICKGAIDMDRATESTDNLKICTNCGHLSTNKIDSLLVQCCPEDHHVSIREFIKDWEIKKDQIKIANQQVEELIRKIK